MTATFYEENRKIKIDISLTLVHKRVLNVSVTALKSYWIL